MRAEDKLETEQSTSEADLNGVRALMHSYEIVVSCGSCRHGEEVKCYVIQTVGKTKQNKQNKTRLSISSQPKLLIRS